MDVRTVPSTGAGTFSTVLPSVALGESLVFLDYKKESHLFPSTITDMQHSYKVLMVIKGLP